MRKNLPAVQTFLVSLLCGLLTACAPAGPQELTLEPGKSASIGMGMDLVFNKVEDGKVTGEVRCSGKSEPFSLKENEEFTTECGRTVVLDKLTADNPEKMAEKAVADKDDATPANTETKAANPAAPAPEKNEPAVAMAKFTVK